MGKIEVKGGVFEKKERANVKAKGKKSQIVQSVQISKEKENILLNE